MATVYHRYIAKGEKFEPPAPEIRRAEPPPNEERAQLDSEWRRKRISAESARQRLHEAKLLAMKGELISRQHVTKQATFLVLSLRGRLMQVAEQHARELAAIADERELQLRLDAILREVLDEIASLPERVSDPDWLSKIDDELEWAPSKRPRRVAK